MKRFLKKFQYSGQISYREKFPSFQQLRKWINISQQLATVAQQLRLEVPQEELDRMITRVDTDRDGYVNLEDFSTILAIPIKQIKI